MGRYIARRLLVAVPTLLALSFLIFSLVSAAPGDPAEELARRLLGGGGQDPSAADIRAAQRELHLDKPFFAQYGLWLKDMATGDGGLSFSKKRPVMQVIGERVGATVELAGAAFVLIVAVSIPLGILAALYHRRWPDQLLRVVALIGASMPSFFFAYLLIIYLVTHLKLLPVGGRGGFDTLIMPAIVLAVLPTAIVSRLLRSSLLEVLGEDFIRTARSKGVSGFGVVARHGLRNAAIPVVTYLGTLLGYLLEGVIITEFIFSWPGLGSLTFEAISQRDYPMIQAVVLLSGAVYIGLNLLVDVSYALLDPRIRLEGRLERV
jgi:peptide/nickel transport system permease protein